MKAHRSPRRELDHTARLRCADLPDWLPSPVREYVSGAWQGDENALAILRRIATTPKMQVVWNTLKKCHASDDALRDFVSCACQQARFHGHKIYPMMTRKERDARAKRFSDAADLCREIIPPSGRSRIRPKLVKAASIMADFFEAGARLEGSWGSPFVVENRIEDDEIRAYVGSKWSKMTHFDISRGAFAVLHKATITSPAVASTGFDRHSLRSYAFGK